MAKKPTTRKPSPERHETEERAIQAPVNPKLQPEATLGAVAVTKFWDVCEEIERKGGDPARHVDLINAYATAFGDWSKAQAEIKARGFLVKDAKGNMKQNPWVAVRADALATVERLQRELGLRPDSQLPNIPAWREFADFVVDEALSEILPEAEGWAELDAWVRGETNRDQTSYRKARGGRTLEWTLPQMVEAICHSGGNKSEAVRYLRKTFQRPCARNTIERYIERFPILDRVFDLVRETRLDWYERALNSFIEAGDFRALNTALLTQGKERGYTKRSEITGANGGEIKTSDPEAKSMFMAAMDELARLKAGQEPA